MRPLKFQSLLAVQIQNFINLRRFSGTDYQSQAQLLGYFDRFLVEEHLVEPRITRKIVDRYLGSLSHLAPRTRLNRFCVVKHGLVLCTFNRDGTDHLAVEQQEGFLPGNKTEEGTDSRQPGIASSGTAIPCIFKMIEEVEHERFLDIFNTKFLDIFLQRVGGVAQQQLNCIAIRQNGIRRKAFLNRQIVAKEGLYEVSNIVCHFISPLDLT